MTRTQIVITSAAAVATFAVLFARYDEARLRTNNHSLREQIEERANPGLAEVVAAVQRDVKPVAATEMPPASGSPTDAGELLRLRGEVTSMRQELTAMMTPSNLFQLDRNAQVKANTEAMESGVLMNEEETKMGFPKSSWVFSGYSTPKAATQSLLWALSQGDVKAISQCYTPEALQWKTEQQWKGKTESEIAEMLKETMKETTGFRAVGQMLSPPLFDETHLMLTAEDATGKSQQRQVTWKKSGNEWKCVSESLSASPPPARFDPPPSQ